MKITSRVKISPLVELTSPILLQCKDDGCGSCPNNTGKLLWIPKLWQVDTAPILNFQYNFFDKSAESTTSIKYNLVESNIPFGNKPNKAYAIANNAIDTTMSPSLMKLGNTLQYSFDVVQSSSVGFWLFFRQSNPAINNVHDALCFEYNHEKKLITFRSF